MGLYYLKTDPLDRESFSIVPGLVNVQQHLGSNHSAFLVIFFFNSLVPNRWGIFLIGGVLPWLGLSLSILRSSGLFFRAL